MRIKASVLFASLTILVGCGSSSGGDVAPAADATPSDAASESGGDAAFDAAADSGAMSESGADAGPVDAATVKAGTPCTTIGKDPACGPLLTCGETQMGLLCGGRCDPFPSQTKEMSQCGPESTCLVYGEGTGADPTCVSKCPCAKGFVCTGWWYTHSDGVSDFPGCETFCVDDTHCTAGKKCNVRTGQCGPSGFDPTLRADGSPCDASATSPQCRGACFRADATPTHGVCVSLVNGSVTSECPDPGVSMALPPYESLGVCAYKNCATGADCTAPHICRYPEDASGPLTAEARNCDYPTTDQPTGS